MQDVAPPVGKGAASFYEAIKEKVNPKHSHLSNAGAVFPPFPESDTMFRKILTSDSFSEVNLHGALLTAWSCFIPPTPHPGR